MLVLPESERMTKKLSELKPGQRAIIRKFGSQEIHLKLMEMGCLPGESISVERVRDNAQQLSQTFGRELHRVMFHGVLHLCGYMDKTKEEKKKMRGREEILLLNYFK